MTDIETHDEVSHTVQVSRGALESALEGITERLESLERERDQSEDSEAKREAEAKMRLLTAHRLEVLIALEGREAPPAF